MEILNNLDIFSVGLAVAGTFILGFSVYFNNRQSFTNKTFLLFSIVTGSWGIVNYFQYQFSSPVLTLWLIRLVMFFAVWQAFLIFQFFYAYPDEKKKLSKLYRFALIPLVTVTSLVTLSPYLFSSIIGETRAGAVAQVQKGPGILLFAIVAIGLVIIGVSYFVYKIRRHPAIKDDRVPSFFILFGTFLMFLLIIPFNFILPNLFSDIRFIPLGAIFTIPFVVLAAYAIFNSKVFSLKLFGISTLVFLLTMATFFEIILSTDLASKVFRSSVFLLVLGSGIILIKGVMREVQQREKIEKLAVDLSKANDKLKVANEKLKELDRQKTEFVSIASHQLRSPLTAIKGYTSMLLEGSFGPIEEKARGAIDRVYESSQKLVTVIEDFLNITRIELGRMKYEISVFDLGTLAQTVVKDQEPNVKKRGLTIEFQDGTGNHQISADSGKVTQVVSNIIDNSIKYTPSGGVKITVANLPAGRSKTKENVRLTVSDTGVGIDKATLPKLFDKFVRADDAGKTNISGTGLGLYVAKQIVEGLGGKIWAESEGKGKGSQFIVEFPRSTEAVTQVKSQVEAYTKADLAKLQNTKK